MPTNRSADCRTGPENLSCEQGDSGFDLHKYDEKGDNMSCGECQSNSATQDSSLNDTASKPAELIYKPQHFKSNTRHDSSAL